MAIESGTENLQSELKSVQRIVDLSSEFLVNYGFQLLGAIITEDAEIITIPNRHIVGEVIRNSFANLVVESSVGISYDSDVDAAAVLIGRVLQECGQVAKEPSPQVGIQRFGESAIEMGFRYWVPTKQYFQTQYAVNGRVLSALLRSGIVIPSPRREVRLIQ